MFHCVNLLQVVTEVGQVLLFHCGNLLQVVIEL